MSLYLTPQSKYMIFHIFVYKGDITGQSYSIMPYHERYFIGSLLYFTWAERKAFFFKYLEKNLDRSRGSSI